MATHSTISIQNNDGSIDSVYCHWDGYATHNGRILLTHYNSEQRVRELISMGPISSLGPEIGDKRVGFDNPPKEGVCRFYGRDIYGQLDHEPTSWHDLDSWRKFGEEYDYIFINGTWRVRCSDTGGWLVPVEQQLERELSELAHDLFET